MCYLCLSFIGDAEKRNIDSTCVSNRIFSCAIYPVVTVCTQCFHPRESAKAVDNTQFLHEDNTRERSSDAKCPSHPSSLHPIEQYLGARVVNRQLTTIHNRRNYPII